jgi:hypothetical protein
MRRRSGWRLRLCFAVIAGISVVSSVADAQQAMPAGAVEANLIRQDQSDCANSTVSDDPTRIGGTVWVVRQSDGNTSVKVAITASPKTVYHFNLKCVRQLGDITTQDEGEGIATFTYPTNAVGAVYGFDMYPDGAPAGNKFQSMQIKF